MSNHETAAAGPEVSPEKTRELEKIGEQQKEILRESLEAAETAHEGNSNKQRASLEALDSAESINEKKHATREQSPAERRRSPSKQQRDASFRSQMRHIQDDMKPSERLFSKLIHIKAVEKTTDILAATVARPNALFISSIFAFISVTVLYLLSKNYGYPLSGFETIGAAAIGWILGMIYDYAKLLISGKKQ